MMPTITKNMSLMDYVLKYFHTHDVPPDVQPIIINYGEAHVKLTRNIISLDEYVHLLTAIIPRLKQNNLCKALIHHYQATINLMLSEIY